MLDPVLPSTDAPSFHAKPSQIDASINWVRRADPGLIEARYVRRTDDYFVVYLSSQTGCRQACRMCHLTATKQTQTRDVTLEELHAQADVVLDHYRQIREARPAKSVHFNFMARGEPLASPVMVHHSAALFDGLWRRARDLAVRPRFLVSTILPRALGDRALEDVFDRYHPELYYSLYSTDEAFRRRWLPNALPVDDALDRLAAWQRATYKIVKIHHAFIEGENDREADVHAICDALEARDLYVHVNLVRYNPASEGYGREPAAPVIERNAAIYRQRLPRARVKVIPRVGFDVAASCGMFVDAER
ncbi:MAG: radical SAM protein [Myxococcales bacterium]|nr:radical SAM protein [Myxococcales bacterium]